MDNRSATAAKMDNRSATAARSSGSHTLNIVRRDSMSSGRSRSNSSNSGSQLEPMQSAVAPRQDAASSAKMERLRKIIMDFMMDDGEPEGPLPVAPQRIITPPKYGVIAPPPKPVAARSTGPAPPQYAVQQRADQRLLPPPAPATQYHAPTTYVHNRNQLVTGQAQQQKQAVPQLVVACTPPAPHYTKPPPPPVNQQQQVVRPLVAFTPPAAHYTEPPLPPPAEQQQQQADDKSLFAFEFHELYEPDFEERRKAYGTPAYTTFFPYTLFGEGSRVFFPPALRHRIDRR